METGLQLHVRKLVIYTLFLLLPLLSSGQTAYSLKMAVDTALKRNPVLNKYRIDLVQRGLLDKAALGDFFPKIDVTGGYSYFSQNAEVNMSLMKESMDNVAGRYGAVIAKDLGLSPGSQEEIYNTIVNGLDRLPAENIVIDQQHYPNLSIQLFQPIFTGGKLLAKRKFAQTGMNMSRIKLEIAEDEVRSKVTDYYLRVMLLADIVETRRAIYNDLKKHEADVLKSIDAGLIPAHIALRAQVMTSDAYRKLQHDSVRLQVAYLSLKYEMGIDPSAPIILTDSLQYKPLIVDFNSMEAQMESSQLAFKLLDEKWSLVKQRETVSKSGFWPDIGAFADVNFFRDYYPVVLPPVIVGVQLKWNIFNGLSDFHRAKAGKYAYDKLEFERQQTDKEIRLWMNRSYAEAENFNRMYHDAGKTEKLARRNVEIMRKRFKEGLGVSRDVLDAETMYAAVKTERLTSLYMYYVSLNQLYMASGNPGKFIEILSN